MTVSEPPGYRRGNLLYTAREINDKRRLLANGCYASMRTVHNGPWRVIALMNGAMMFAVDLARDLDRARRQDPRFDSRVTLELCTMHLGRGDTPEEAQAAFRGSGQQGPMPVLVVDDICDTADTLKAALKVVGWQCPVQAVYTAVMFTRKRAGTQEDPQFHPSFTGIWVDRPDWLYGYGMDHPDGGLRELPDVYGLPDHVEPAA